VSIVLPLTTVPAPTHGLPAAADRGADGLTRTLPLDADPSTAGTGDRSSTGRAEA
jgi:hypothetical protein